MLFLIFSKYFFILRVTDRQTRCFILIDTSLLHDTNLKTLVICDTGSSVPLVEESLHLILSIVDSFVQVILNVKKMSVGCSSGDQNSWEADNVEENENCSVHFGTLVVSEMWMIMLTKAKVMINNAWSSSSWIRLKLLLTDHSDDNWFVAELSSHFWETRKISLKH